ncbi:MAG: AraC family transcriptional regulator [Chitinivibrionales bacterium]|nr:AraC family transcriptional regulator [Chitinivibrionales bacterium]
MVKDYIEKIEKNLDHDFGLMVNRQLRQAPVGLHSHGFSELVVILSGKGIHYSKTDAYEIMTGDCFMVEGEHGYRESIELNLVNILFKPNRLPLPWNEARKLPGYHAFFTLEPKYRKLHDFRSRLRFSPAELSIVSRLIDDMERELMHRHPGFEFIAMALFVELLTLIARTYTNKKGKIYPGLFGLSEVIGHCERRYAERIRMADLTKIACMSESRLLRAFKNATGFSPIDYLIRLRIRHACAYLHQGNLTISEIAYRVGFNDSNYFSRQFKRAMGLAPREYRRKNPLF